MALPGDETLGCDLQRPLQLHGGGGCSGWLGWATNKNRLIVPRLRQKERGRVSSRPDGEEGLPHVASSRSRLGSRKEWAGLWPSMRPTPGWRQHEPTT